MKLFDEKSTLRFMGRVLFFSFTLLITGCQDIYTKKTDSFSSLPCLRGLPQEMATQLSIPQDETCLYSLRVESDHKNSACENNPNAKVQGKGHFFRISVYEQQREVYRAQINFTANSDAAMQKLMQHFKDDMGL